MKVTQPKPKKRVVPKVKRIKSLKRKLWIAISLHVRKSHADHTGYLTLADTGESCHWRDCDCGHLFANTERNQQLGGNELWFYEKNYAPQSRKGNRFGADNSAHEYMLWAIHRYGLEEVEKMRRMRNSYKLWTEEELTELLKHYEHRGTETIQ